MNIFRILGEFAMAGLAAPESSKLLKELLLTSHA
jgi:hypothetical protein